MLADTIRGLLLEHAGIRIDGPDPWDIQIKDDRWYGRVWRHKNLGLGESYMDAWWECERLDEMICRLLAGGIEREVRGGLKYRIGLLPTLMLNLQSRSRSRRNAARHYDLGNDLFLSFLDSYNQYSCGYFAGADDLEQAQQYKMEMISRKLDLTPENKVLDIGCGWGGLARYLAGTHGCTVTAVNVSREQLRFAQESCPELPIRFVDCDYRSIDGSFDKIVSVGMFEHVGADNYREFMKVVHRCLEDDGIFLLHTIGANISRQSGTDPWIAKYIFPNSLLPSMAQISSAAEKLFIIEDWHNIGPHYDRTLMAWNARFQEAWPRLRLQYDARFKRMWEYYLLSCAGAFRARDLQVWQIVMTKYGSATAQPSCRPSVGDSDGMSRFDRECCG